MSKQPTSISIGDKNFFYDEKTGTYIKLPVNSNPLKGGSPVSGTKRPKLQKHEEDSEDGEEVRTDNRPKKARKNGRNNHKFRISIKIYMSDERNRDLDGVLSTLQDCLRDAIAQIGNPEGLPHDDNRFWITEIGGVTVIQVDDEKDAGADIILERLTESGGLVICENSTVPVLQPQLWLPLPA